MFKKFFLVNHSKTINYTFCIAKKKAPKKIYKLCIELDFIKYLKVFFPLSLVLKNYKIGQTLRI